MTRCVSIVSKIEGEISKIDALSSEFYSARTIYLTGTIDDALAEEIITEIRCLSRKNKQPITIIINSPGGGVCSGLAIIDVMRACGCEIHTVAAGMAASMASMILACGTKGHRSATEHSEVMIHQPLGGVSGQASDISIAADHVIKTRSLLAEMLAECSGKDTDRVLNDMDRDKWLTAQGAVEYGIIDEIVKEI